MHFIYSLLPFEKSFEPRNYPSIIPSPVQLNFVPASGSPVRQTKRKRKRNATKHTPRQWDRGDRAGAPKSAGPKPGPARWRWTLSEPASISPAWSAGAGSLKRTCPCRAVPGPGYRSQLRKQQQPAAGRAAEPSTEAP